MKYVTTPALRNKAIRNGIVLDTNLLILYIVGQENPKKIKKHQKLKKFDEEDFFIVQELIEKSKNKIIYLTPQTIPETMFLLGNDPRTDKDSKRIIPTRTLTVTTEILKVASEKIYTPTPRVIQEEELWAVNQYGLPDLSFMDGVLKEDLAFLSDDSNLVSYMFDRGISAKIYNDYKSDMRILRLQ